MALLPESFVRISSAQQHESRNCDTVSGRAQPSPSLSSSSAALDRAPTAAQPARGCSALVSALALPAAPDSHPLPRDSWQCTSRACNSLSSKPTLLNALSASARQARQEHVAQRWCTLSSLSAWPLQLSAPSAALFTTMSLYWDSHSSSMLGCDSSSHCRDSCLRLQHLILRLLLAVQSIGFQQHNSHSPQLLHSQPQLHLRLHSHQL